MSRCGSELIGSIRLRLSAFQQTKYSSGPITLPQNHEQILSSGRNTFFFIRFESVCGIDAEVRFHFQSRRQICIHGVDVASRESIASLLA